MNKLNSFVMLSIAFVLLFSCSKGEDITPKTCITVPPLSENLVGLWKMSANGKSIEFKSNKTYVDIDKYFNPVDETKGPYTFKWGVSGNNINFTAESDLNLDKTTLVIKSFVCDTLFIDKAGLINTPLVRQ